MLFMEYLKNPKAVGAWAPSSRFLAKKMVQSIDFDSCKCIVEYGPGTGVFTDEIVNRKRKDTVFIAVEQNERFFSRLKDKYKNETNVVVLHGDAADIEAIMRKYGHERADYIISGLPFTSLPKEVSHKIYLATQKVIGRTGVFITFQYTLLKKQVFMEWFNIERITFELINFPSAFVLEMRNR